jgi:hypothetical protein
MMGRPPKYKPEYCQLLLDHMESGLSYLSFAGKVRVAFKTLFEWEKDYPEFKEAKEQGMALSLLWDEDLLNRGTNGKVRGYNAASHKWKMTNRYKWSDRTEVLSKDAANLNIEDLKKEAAELLAKLED